MEKKVRFWKGLMMTAKVLGMICGAIACMGFIALCISLFLWVIGQTTWSTCALIFAGIAASAYLMFAFVALMDCSEEQMRKFF